MIVGKSLEILDGSVQCIVTRDEWDSEQLIVITTHFVDFCSSMKNCVVDNRHMVRLFIFRTCPSWLSNKEKKDRPT